MSKLVVVKEFDEQSKTDFVKIKKGNFTLCIYDDSFDVGCETGYFSADEEEFPINLIEKSIKEIKYGKM